MLTIKRIKKYNMPKYPCGNYFDFKRNFIEKNLIKGAASLFMAAALLGVGCGEEDVTGGLPVVHMVSENEAEVIIVKMLKDNGIDIAHNQDYQISLDSGKTINVNLDGYSNDNKVGYEYVNHDSPNGDYIVEEQ